ncbi:hypothetical protein [Maribacter sp. 2-571]|uniref:hypothetical protein n=1 Tax=Maribacter sp. 2-571 TaxID=3417569 RepID=UPI003D3378B0
MSLEVLVLIFSLIASLIKGLLFLGDKKQRKRLRRSFKNVKKLLRPYIINRRMFRTMLLLDCALFVLGTVLSLVYMVAITRSHNFYLATFIAALLMAANINLLYRGIVVFKALQKSLT